MTLSRFRTGGALTDEHAAVYVERRADQEALGHLRATDYLLIVEPRQQGKTSLINRLMRHPALGGVGLAYLDVTTPDRSDEASWYGTICPRILRQLRTIIPRDQWPAVPQTSAGWRDFLWEVAALAADAQRRVVIALDEIGAVTFPGGTEFFSVLRDVYSSRQAEREFRQLIFLLAGAFHPRDLIEDDRVSPFNIAQRVRLSDFTLVQVRQLVGQGGWPDDQASALAVRIHDWTGGQPYLTQVLCSYLGPDATPADVDAGVERLRREDENHLPPMLKRLDEEAKLREYVGKVQAGERIRFYPRENRRQAQLELVGVLKADDDGYCAIRNRIYQRVLEESFMPASGPAIPAPEATPIPAPAAAAAEVEAGPETAFDYAWGLEALKAQVDRTNRFGQFDTLEARLRENLQDEERYGYSQQVRSDRSRIVDQLNRMARETLGISFNDLCRGQLAPGMQVSAGALSLVRKLGVPLTPGALAPPVETRRQHLPLEELTWEQFEALCAALVEANPLTISCNLYGVAGDEQQGIDIVATQRGAAGEETWAYQCKRYREYTPGQLQAAIAKMIYPADYYVLMLSIPAKAALRQIADGQASFFLWDGIDLARKLKNYPNIVQDFFGAAWRQAFCG